MIFALAVFVFHLLFTRLFIKTDDGNFLGIVSSPDFTYLGWLTERYNTVSGRTVGEFLVAFFLKHNLLFWKIINTAMITYIAFFWYKLSEAFCGGFSESKKQIFCCCGIFTMLVTCLNPSVFWYAGSLSYLWPFAGVLMTVSPLVFCVLKGRVSSARLISSFFTAFIGTMQEQAAACCTALYLILIAAIIYKKIKIKISMFLPMIPIFICDYFLFTSPGAEGRSVMEANASFSLYTDYGIFQKLLCGLASFFSNSYYLSNFLIIVFIALLSVAIYNNSKTKSKSALIGINIFSAAVCVAVNYGVAAFEKALPHIIFRNSFTKGSFDVSFYILFSLGCVLSAVIAVMVCILIRQNPKIGLIIGICVAAGFFSALAMGFSPTVFSSGQRTGFYTNMFVVTACVILLSSSPKTKLTSFIYNAFTLYAGITFTLNCFAFKLFEHPLMG